MPESKTYDYIIAGMGCAGLSLAIQLKRSKLPFKKILLIDQDLKDKNDRTWCFWTKEKNNWFDTIIFREWEKFKFKSNSFEEDFKLEPYRYVLIRGIDFYTTCLNELKEDARFEIVTERIEEVGTENGMAFLKTKGDCFLAPLLFNSAFRKQQSKPKEINYVQHFRGWLIECKDEVFDESCPTFMNFDTEQFNDCRFFYVIPFSKTKALVEYTGFSPSRLSDQEYDVQLKNHIEKDLNISDYTIIERENGEIPMTENEFVNPFGKYVVNIGTAGGNSKPSTGYTFYFIQKNTQRIIKQLQNGLTSELNFKRDKRFEVYDKILLEVLDKKSVSAREVFTTLFQKNKTTDLLAFLNEESTLIEDLRILNSVPKAPFVASAIKKFLKY